MKHLKYLFIFLTIISLNFEVNGQAWGDLDGLKQKITTNKISLVLIDNSYSNTLIVDENLTSRYIDKIDFFRLDLSNLKELDNILPNFTKNTKSRIELPTLLFLDLEKHIIQTFHGERTTYELQLLMEYFGYGYFENIPWSKFKKIHKI